MTSCRLTHCLNLSCMVATLCVAAAQPAEAALVKYGFSGTLTEASSILVPSLAVGNDYTATFTVDTSKLGEPYLPLSNTGKYEGALTEFSFQVQGLTQSFTLTATGDAYTRQVNSRDRFQLSSLDVNGTVDGWSFYALIVWFDYPEFTLFDNVFETLSGIPTLPSTGLLSDSFGQFRIDVGDPETKVAMQFNIRGGVVPLTPVSTVPTPSTLALLGVAILAMTGAARRVRMPAGPAGIR